MIDKFKLESRKAKASDQFIETLKTLMEQIDSTISNSKEEFVLSLDELQNEEKLLSKEIEIYDKKIQNWSTNKNDMDTSFYSNSKKNTTLNEKYSSSSDLLKEVIDFDVGIKQKVF